MKVRGYCAPGRVLFLERMVKFAKPPLSVPDQVRKLKARGLVIADDAFAESCLHTIGYYRLSAYALPFQQGALPDKPFIAGTTLASILDLYTFDRELRGLLSGALERIEIGFRSVLINHMCITHGSHWFMERSLFVPDSWRFNFDKLIRKIEEELDIPDGGSSPARPHAEVFINHYYTKYGDPYLPPAWMIGETLSLGTWSRIYSNLRNGSDRQIVASFFGFNEAIFIEWMHTLAHVRNLCAHHSRLWNRRLVIKARTPHKHRVRIPLATSERVYDVAVVVFDLLRSVEPSTHWNKRLEELIQRHPSASARIAGMGFPPLWRKDTFWDLRLHPDDPLCHI